MAEHRASKGLGLGEASHPIASSTSVHVWMCTFTPYRRSMYLALSSSARVSDL